VPDSFLNNYFGFNKQQRNGLLVLTIISCALLLIRIFYPAFIKPDKILIRDLPLVERRIDSSYNTTRKIYKPRPDNAVRPVSLFVFDPNTVSREQLLQLGLKEKTAQIFLKFRNKGFVFKEKKDLLKVYGISNEQYTILEPYILISYNEASAKRKETVETRSISPQPSKTPVKTELNSADSLNLIAIPGIGPVYAKRILKYREILGGYIVVDQLKEVYGLSEEVYEKIKHFFSVDAGKIKKINLNTDDFKRINKHPYLSYTLTKTIFDWRRKTTLNATNLKDIINDNSLYQKLLPYLTFE
jgi:competence protein ComEA